MSISHKELLATLDYDCITGKFIWKRCARKSIRSGKIAGTTTKDGRIKIMIHGKLYMAHRLAWFYVYGKWPSLDIDHIDGNPSNNSIYNLREVTKTVNQQNRKKQQKNKNNPALPLGVWFDSSRQAYVSQIRVNKKQVYVGQFSSADDAHAAYLAVKRKLHEGCTI